MLISSKFLGRSKLASLLAAASLRINSHEKDLNEG
jgi:hypothetical protein